MESIKISKYIEMNKKNLRKFMNEQSFPLYPRSQTHFPVGVNTPFPEQWVPSILKIWRNCLFTLFTCSELCTSFPFKLKNTPMLIAQTSKKTLKIVTKLVFEGFFYFLFFIFCFFSFFFSGWEKFLEWIENFLKKQEFKP